MVDFETVEDGIIAAINAGLPEVKTVEAYAGQFELKEDIKQLPINFPAVFVVYGESLLEWVDGPNFNETPEYATLIAVKNESGNKALRKEAYGIIKDVIKTLTNNKLGLDIERLQPTRISLVFISKSIAIYGVDFKTNFDTTY